MKQVDLSANRFGNLVVLTIAESYGKNIKWKCICDCGRSVIVASNNLRSGNTKSCGCLRHKNVARRIDLSGQLFGRLTVLEFVFTNKGNAHWLCVCSCGNRTIVKALKLQRGTTKSCGCYRNDVQKNRRSVGDAKWARIVKLIGERCVACGEPSDLHAHHIYPVNSNKHLQHDFTNGVALCMVCHKKFHKIYGNLHIGPKELSLFLGLPVQLQRALTLVSGYKFRKSGVEDLHKAIHEIQLMIDMEESHAMSNSTGKSPIKRIKKKILKQAVPMEVANRA